MFYVFKDTIRMALTNLFLKSELVDSDFAR